MPTSLERALALGAIVAAGGYLLSTLVSAPWALGLTALLAGLGLSLMHSRFQAWATEVVPQARGTAVALFSGSLFLGSALGTGLGSSFADRGEYQTIFGVTVVVLLGLLFVSSFARWLYDLQLAKRGTGSSLVD